MSNKDVKLNKKMHISWLKKMHKTVTTRMFWKFYTKYKQRVLTIRVLLTESFKVFEKWLKAHQLRKHTVPNTEPSTSIYFILAPLSSLFILPFTLSFEFIRQPSTKPFFTRNFTGKTCSIDLKLGRFGKRYNTWTCLCTSPWDHFYNQAPVFSFLGIQRHMCNSTKASDHRLLTVI